MSYYIQLPKNQNKAQQLCVLHDAQLFIGTGFDCVKDDEALICVIQNDGFDAAALIPNEEEFNRFLNYKDRSKTWLVMNKEKAHKLAKYKEDETEEEKLGLTKFI